MVCVGFSKRRILLVAEIKRVKKRTKLNVDEKFRGDSAENITHDEGEALEETVPGFDATEKKPDNFARRNSMSMIDPSDWSLEDSQEPYCMRDGTEAKLRIVAVTKGTDKNDCMYLQPRLEVVGEDFSKDFTHFLHIPDRKMSAKQLNRVKSALRAFMDAF